ncbi:uncharacterized protein [Diabrotica undecimpunctata]|uniref:uncharacterized protein n=1 Tax=Diabrotica undecimpunctata TaxID=50387 RepID=UPI003B640B26
MFNIKKRSGIVAAMQRSSVIIWGEYTLAHKHSLEALHRSMQDLNGNDKLFDGAVLLRSGDFSICLKQSFLCRNVKTVRLTINIRVQVQSDLSAQIFAKHLLDTENGKIKLHPNTQGIKLPDNFCTLVETKHESILSVFPAILNNNLNQNWLSERAIWRRKMLTVLLMKTKP